MAINRQNLPEISKQTKQSWRPMRQDYSAGGIAYRRLADSGIVEIALIATRGGTRWQLPKGSREENESSIETAIREVEEEVGLLTEYEASLQTIDYWYWDTYRKAVPELVHKSVDFYLLRVIGGTLSDECYEVDAVGWFTPQQAMKMLSFDGETDVLKLAMETFSSGG